jgi:hypothetical protein
MAVVPAMAASKRAAITTLFMLVHLPVLMPTVLLCEPGADKELRKEL